MHLGTHLISDALDLFLLDCEARRLTPATRQFYSVKLSLFLRWCDDEDIHALQELTAHHLRRLPGPPHAPQPFQPVPEQPGPRHPRLSQLLRAR